MMPVSQDDLRNALLRALPSGSFGHLAAELTPVTLGARFELTGTAPDQDWVYFPESGVASVLARAGRGWQEVGLFGPDGAGCLLSLLAPDGTPYRIEMVVPGHGHRVAAATLLRCFKIDPEVRRVMLGFLQLFIVQLSQSCIANSRFNTVQRMARWFLMVHDRVDGNPMTLTHEAIATTLGVGRTGVTLALHTLEAARLISTARRRVTILDRVGLERMTDGLYAPPETTSCRRAGGE